jgi:sugar phosphate isomerase/epimerase
MNEQFYVSTLAFNGKSLEEITNISKESNLNLEFSSNLIYEDKNIEIFNEFSGKKLLHNYFPPPKNSFVINLASDNQKILNLSVEHCKENILRTAYHKLPFYSIHAGFCLDPKISSLGKLIKAQKNFDRNKYFVRFKEVLSEIIKFAEAKNVKLLIENNVLSKDNFTKNNFQNLFLCVESEEIIEIMNEIDKPNFGLLLDTAHLKVSSSTLGLNLLEEVNKLLSYVKAVHHSDNDGISDSNDSIINDYWFLPFMKKLKESFHVLEVRNLEAKSIKKQLKILSDAI